MQVHLRVSSSRILPWLISREQKNEVDLDGRITWSGPWTLDVRGGVQRGQERGGASQRRGTQGGPEVARRTGEGASCGAPEVGPGLLAGWLRSSSGRDRISISEDLV